MSFEDPKRKRRAMERGLRKIRFDGVGLIPGSCLGIPAPDIVAAHQIGSQPGRYAITLFQRNWLLQGEKCLAVNQFGLAWRI